MLTWTLNPLEPVPKTNIHLVWYQTDILWIWDWSQISLWNRLSVLGGWNKLRCPAMVLVYFLFHYRLINHIFCTNVLKNKAYDMVLCYIHYFPYMFSGLPWGVVNITMGHVNTNYQNSGGSCKNSKQDLNEWGVQWQPHSGLTFLSC